VDCRAKNKHKPDVQTGPETRSASFSVSNLPRVKGWGQGRIKLFGAPRQ